MSILVIVAVYTAVNCSTMWAIAALSAMKDYERPSIFGNSRLFFILGITLQNECLLVQGVLKTMWNSCKKINMIKLNSWQKQNGCV